MSRCRKWERRGRRRLERIVSHRPGDLQPAPTSACSCCRRRERSGRWRAWVLYLCSPLLASGYSPEMNPQICPKRNSRYLAGQSNDFCDRLFAVVRTHPPTRHELNSVFGKIRSSRIELRPITRDKSSLLAMLAGREALQKGLIGFGQPTEYALHHPSCRTGRAEMPLEGKTHVRHRRLGGTVGNRGDSACAA